MKSNDKEQVFSQYARIFDCDNPNFDDYDGWSLAFLKAKQQYFNDLLKSRGYVFLNEVYEALGFKKTDEFKNVGWVYREKDPIGDIFVDFGIYQNINRGAINGTTADFILDFNHDGEIKDKIFT